MKDSDKIQLKKYIGIIEKFIKGSITPLEFESLYLDTFKNEKHTFDRSIFEILARLFGDVDAYCADPSLRDENDLNEQQLLENAKLYFISLIKMSDDKEGNG